MYLVHLMCPVHGKYTVENTQPRECVRCAFTGMYAPTAKAVRTKNPPVVRHDDGCHEISPVVRVLAGDHDSDRCP